MVLMLDRGMGRISEIPPLPPFITAEELLADALPLLEPPSRMSVTEAAEQYLMVPAQLNWATYDRLTAPYTVEPQDMTQSRRFKAVCFVGPSQCGKSQMLLSTVAHSVICAPGPVQVIHMTKTDAESWVEEKLDPAIFNSKFIRERLGTGSTDSTFSRKRFKGMRLTIGYPVAQQLSSRTQRMVLLTDYDHMPQKLGTKEAPEGSPFGMALLRVRQFFSRGCVFVESTPAFPIDKTAIWDASPEHPHMMPPTTAGIVNIYNDGTRGRWYWECPDCAQVFEPRIDRLKYDQTLDPGAAGADAEMECPHCHALIAHRHKAALNAAALLRHGGWLHEGRQLDDQGRRVLVDIHDSQVRHAPIASYALNGAAAAFAPWSEIVERFESARRRMAMNGDDTDLAKVYYTDIGLPYRRAGEDEDEITVDLVREASTDLPPQTCPEWARFVTCSVDVNGSWFAVAYTAWGLDGRGMLIDRFDLHQPPAGAPRATDSEGRWRAIEPGKYAEDAEVLLPLLEREYPVHGQPWRLRPCAQVVDFNGPAGWSDNAEKYLRRRRREGLGGRVFLSIGRPGFKVADRVWYASPERGAGGKKARSIRFLNMAVDRLKDSVLAGVVRGEDGPGALLVSRHIDRERIEELLAERRGLKGYEKRQGAGRNETLDLMVQALACAEHLGMNRINPEAPPDWAVLSMLNPFAAITGAPPSSDTGPQNDTPRNAGGAVRYLRRN